MSNTPSIPSGVLVRLMARHRQEMDDLLARQRYEIDLLVNRPSAPLPSGLVLSAKNIPLHKGDKVILLTTASIGTKGDLATVTHVESQRIELFVHRVTDHTWRHPNSLYHAAEQDC